MIRKGMIIAIGLVTVFSLAACDYGDENNHQENDKSTNNQDTKSHLENRNYGNDAFKEVMVAESKEEIVVTGKARVFEGVFQYAIVSPKEIVKQETYQTDGAPAWGDFKFSIDKKFTAKEGVMLELFVYSAKDGSKTNTLEIPLNVQK